MCIMVWHTTRGIKFGYLIIKSFLLLAPHRFYDATKFNLVYPDPAMIENISERLRWYRYRKGLLQSEVAEYIGVYRTTYVHYEEQEIESIPINKLEKIAEILEVDVTELMDEYTLFIYRGQGKEVKARREKMNMTMEQYAQHLRISLNRLSQWEEDKAQMLRSSWEKYFK